MRPATQQAHGECLECGRDWDHCHGALVVHLDGSFECSELVCVAAESAHSYSLSCVELVGGCSCT